MTGLGFDKNSDTLRIFPTAKQRYAWFGRINSVWREVQVSIGTPRDKKHRFDPRAKKAKGPPTTNLYPEGSKFSGSDILKY